MCQFVSLAVILPVLTASIASWLPVALAVRVLVSAKMELKPTQYLNVSDCYLVLQPDFRVILYNRSQPLLSTGTANTQHEGNCTAVMDEYGNFYIYETYANLTSDTVYISSMDAANVLKTFSYLLLRGNGTYNFFGYNSNQMISEGFLFPFNSSAVTPPSVGSSSEVPNIAYPFPPELAWKPQTSLDDFPYMPAEYFLSQGSKLQTVDQRYVLMLGSDCNLQSKIIYKDEKEYVRWQSGTKLNSSEIRNCQLMLQQDGRLEIRNNVSGEVYWNTTVTGNMSVGWVLRLRSLEYVGYLSIEDIEDASNVLWTTNDPNQLLATNNSAVVWTVIGLLVGVCVLAMAVLALVYLNCARTRKGNVRDPAEKAFRRRLEENGGISQTRYSKAEIRQATNNFGNTIGSGGYRDVFFGKLPDGQEIAAKVLPAESHQSKQEFFNELGAHYIVGFIQPCVQINHFCYIELLSVVHHKYLVSLLGYRCTKKQQILVYEFMSGGDLRHRLQGEPAEESPLSWRQRTSISLQVAEGLEYLHDKCSPAIIHRDIESTNILLTDKLVAKVADFGLSKLRTRDLEDATHVTTVVKGTPGYLDPDGQGVELQGIILATVKETMITVDVFQWISETGMLTEKSDVYAFGIVLMEILTGRPQMYIAHRVAEAWRLEQFDDLPDPNLGGGYDIDEFVSLVELSLWCARSSGERPFMRQVVQRLRDLGLAPPEPSQPDIILGDEGQQVMALYIDIENSEDWTGDTLPFSESSCGGMSSEVPHPGTQCRKSGRLWIDYGFTRKSRSSS